MPPKTRNLTCLTLATLLVTAPLAPAPLFAQLAPAAETSANAAAWTRADPKMDRFIADLIAKMTLDEKIGQLSLLTSDWDSTGPTMRDG